MAVSRETDASTRRFSPPRRLNSSNASGRSERNRDAVRHGTILLSPDMGFRSHSVLRKYVRKKVAVATRRGRRFSSRSRSPTRVQSQIALLNRPEAQSGESRLERVGRRRGLLDRRPRCPHTSPISACRRRHSRRSSLDDNLQITPRISGFENPSRSRNRPSRGVKAEI